MCDSEVLKTSCNTCIYGVAANDLKQVKDLASFLFKLLKRLQFKVEHLQHEKMKVGENLIGYRFAMVDQKCQALQAQEVMISTKSKLQGMMQEVFALEEEVHLHPFKFYIPIYIVLNCGFSFGLLCRRPLI